MPRGLRDAAASRLRGAVAATPVGKSLRAPGGAEAAEQAEPRGRTSESGTRHSESKETWPPTPWEEEEAAGAKERAGVVSAASLRPWAGYPSPTRAAPDSPVAVSDAANAVVCLWHGDITRLEIDGIVNAATENLWAGGGICGAIHSAAGPSLAEECQRIAFCPAGRAVITQGYQLPARYVLHAVGPTDQDNEQLRSCYISTLDLAVAHQLRSVALCCVSAGVTGFPLPAATHVALGTVRQWIDTNPDALNQIVFVVFQQHELQMYEELMPFYFPRGAAPSSAEKGKASTLGGRARGAAAAVATLAPEVARKGGAVAVPAAMKVGKVAMSAVAEGGERLDRRRDEWKRLVVKFIKKKVHKQVARIIDKLPDLAKDWTEDPDMPRCVSRGKDRLIDAAWPDIREELLWEAAVKLDGIQDEDDPDHSGPDCVRAYLRYHLQPYDKTFWGNVRDPVWLLFTVASCIPVAGACSFMYFLEFLIIDKSDEYQLITFILQFKGTQFVSQGFLRTFVGFFMFIHCVTVPAEDDDHSCDRHGPGLAGGFLLIVSAFCLQLVLVWLAFILLSCSNERGRAKLKGTVKHIRSTVSLRKGGYIGYFMIYDLICFIICMIALVYVVFSRPEDSFGDWPTMHALFACQIVYGYLSLPFFFFTLPLLRNVLTHALPTAYDPQGRCRKFASSTAISRRRQQQHPVEEEEQTLLEPGEDGSFLEDARSVLVGSTPQAGERPSPPAPAAAFAGATATG